jgi:regulatory protein
MKITDIKQQVKRQGRYSIYVDEKYSFSLSENELLTQGLRINQEFNASEFEQIKKTAVEDKAYTRAIDLLARRARSEWELHDYLKRKDYEEDIITKILNKLSEQGYVNDESFARTWVENRRLLKATSKRRLRMELQQKHINSDVISLVLEEDETDERAVLRDLMAKKRTQSRYLDPQKLIAYCMRQGFNYDDIKSVLSED